MLKNITSLGEEHNNRKILTKAKTPKIMLAMTQCKSADLIAEGGIVNLPDYCEREIPSVGMCSKVKGMSLEEANGIG